MLDNIRWERFAHGIAQGKHATDAYTAAGFKARGRSAETGASRLLRNAEVQQRIEELAAELKTEAIADAEEIQEFLSSVMRGEHSEQAITRSGEIVALTLGGRDRIKAAELLARARGVFDRTEGDGDGQLAAIARALQEPVPERAVN